MKTTYSVKVERTETRTVLFKVRADTEDEARMSALDFASDHDFASASGGAVEYEVTVEPKQELEQGNP